MDKNKITIILVDDHPLIRKALRDELSGQPDFEVIAEATNGEEAISIVKEMSPDVIVMDINMPVINGIEATRQIKSCCPDIAVLVLTVYEEIEHIMSIIDAGASGYLTKNVFGEEIIQAIRGVASGETVLAPKIFKQIMKNTVVHKAKPISLDINEKITARELEILILTARGMNNKLIAEKLNISLRTVKSYLSDIYSKLNVSSRTEAVTVALNADIFKLEDIR